MSCQCDWVGKALLSQPVQAWTLKILTLMSLVCRCQDTTDNAHAGKQRRSNPAEVETFEAEGQLELELGSAEPGDHPGLDSESGLEQLRHVCGRLGIGQHGFLTQQELGQVCHYIGMELMDDEELEELFHKLDVDKDSYISFDEFVSGLSRHTSACPSTLRGFETPVRSPVLRPLSGRKTRTPLPPAQHDRRSPAVYTSGDSLGLFSSLPSSSTGFAKGEDIVDYWERLNIPHGTDLLLSLGFDLKSKIPLKELAFALTSEWTGQVAEAGPLGQALTASYQQELIFLRSVLDQTSEERNKLRSDLADALGRNALMAAEVDERHTQLEKSYETRVRALDQDYQDQVRYLQGEVEKEREAHSSLSELHRQSSEQLQGLQQQIATLKQRLGQAEEEVSIVRRELSHSRERQTDSEAKYKKLKKELHHHQQRKETEQDSPSHLTLEREKLIAIETAERCAAENKELKDRNDELLSQLEQLQQQLSSNQRHNSSGSQGRSVPMSRIPVRTRTSSMSSDTSEWEEEDMSSTEGVFYTHPALAIKEEETDKPPSLNAELKQQQRQKRGERRERERKEIEHGFRVEIAEIEDRFEEDKQHLLTELEKEKEKISEEFQGHLSQCLAEQQRELQNAFALEKQDLVQQYESRINLLSHQHHQQLQELQGRLQQSERPPQADPAQDSATNPYARTRVQELEKAKADGEKQREELQAHYEKELQDLRKKYDGDVADLKTLSEERERAVVRDLFEQGADALQGNLREDFLHLVRQHQQLSTGADHDLADNEELYEAFERERMGLVQHYESQIVGLQDELGSLRRDFEAERAAFQQLQSGDLAQSIRQELQEEVGGQLDALRGSWEEERRELAVQNQLLEEELADLKAMLLQERQRASEAHTLKETVRLLRFENKEVQCLAESLKEKVSRSHQQQDMERANYERRIDELEKEKEKALRVQALQQAGSVVQDSAKDEDMEKLEMEKVIHQVEEAVSMESSPEEYMDQGALDHLQGQIVQLQHQLQEARTAQFEYQQLKEECEFLKQTNGNLEDMLRVLRQRSQKEQIEKEKEEQEQLHECWEEKKKLQNLLQRTTDKLLKTSTEMAAGQTHLVREVEQLKQRAGNMVELETFTGLQVSLLETQRHAITLQEALMQRTQLADRIMAEADKERRQERDCWEAQKQEIQTRLDATTEMYRSLALQHKSLRQSTTKLATQMKELYVENADLMNVLQQTEAKHINAQRQNRHLQRQCQELHGTIHRVVHKK